MITNGSAADGHRVVDEFEQMRYVIHYRFPGLRLEGDSPLLILAARDRATAERLEPGVAKLNGRIAGEFIPAWDRNYAWIRLDDWSKGARETVYHEYTHSVLHLNAHWLPLWLDEGMAEFFAYTRFMDHQIYIGAPTERSRFLSDGRLSPIATMLTARQSSYLKDERSTQLFYAEAWALVHYLTFSPGMDNGLKLARFYDDLQAGKGQMEAFAARFGDPASLDAKFRSYLDKFLTTAGVVPAAPPIDTKSFSERMLTPAEADYELGTFHIGPRDRAGARPLLEQALLLDPTLAGAREEMGFLDYEEGKDEEARAQWKQAYTLDSTRYRAHFAELMTGVPLAQQTPEQLTRTLAELRTVARLNLRFAPAYVEVALLDWRRGDLEGAYRAAMEAERLEPWRAGYRMLTGKILLAQGKGIEAAEVARNAARLWEGTDRDEAVALWMVVPPTQRGSGPALAFDLPAGAQVAHGTLTTLQCAEHEKGTRFTVTFHPDGAPPPTTISMVAGERISLGSTDTLYLGERGMNLCQHSVGRNVMLAYKPTGSGTGELVRLHVLDTLPAIVSSGSTEQAKETATPPP